MKTCSKCNTEKPLTEFVKNKARKDGVSVYCKPCTKEYFSTPKWKEYENNRNKKRSKTEGYKSYQSKYQMKLNNEKYKSDPIFKLKTNFRNRIRKYIDRKSVPSQSILGCSWQTFKEYIEGKFQTGMTWDNHSQFGWHLDHIIPLASAKTEDELYKLNHYTNLQPLWWRYNLSKNDKIVEY